jgi:hypothetical protein
MNLGLDFLDVSKIYNRLYNYFENIVAKQVIFLEEKIMKSLTRKTRSDKFPLTFHPSGHYCKKIKRHIYYFGSDRKQDIRSTLTGQYFYMGIITPCKTVNGNIIL